MLLSAIQVKVLAAITRKWEKFGISDLFPEGVTELVLSIHIHQKVQ